MAKSSKSKTATRRSCFTLIEVLVAVTLTAFLLGMISSVIYLNVRVLKRQQDSIERSQIGRNVMAMIKSDIRNAFQYKPADVTGLDALTISQGQVAGVVAGFGQNSGGALGGLDLGGAASLEGFDFSSLQQGSDAGSGESPSQDIAGATGQVRPGLYGNATEIMIDISRLPRIDQFDPIVQGSEDQTLELPSDIKTISYFVSQESLRLQQNSVGVDPTAGGGLYRRQLDRSVAAFSEDVAAALTAMGNIKLIAKEVVAIEFEYFDGEEWIAEWDSDEMGGFPAAIAITIRVDNERSASDAQSQTIVESETAETYRGVVNLPVAEILEEEETGSTSDGGGAAR